MEIIITIIALIVAAVTGYISYQSKKEAEKSNKIAAHDHQKEILDAFNNFRAEEVQLGWDLSKDTMNSLSKAAHTADLYLEKELAEKLKKYTDYANKAQCMYKRIEVFNNLKRGVPEEYLKEMFLYEDKCRTLEKDIEQGLMDVLRLVKP